MAPFPQDERLDEQRSARLRFIAQVAATGDSAATALLLLAQQEPAPTTKRAAPWPEKNCQPQLTVHPP